MNIHEYQAKEILSRLGVRIPRGRVAFTAKEAEVIAESIGEGPFVVKAQIHAGGRGKSGGIRLAQDPAEARQIAWEMIGMRLATRQTGPEGKPVSRVLIEETVPIARELYLGATVDRKRGKVAVLGSPEGGMDVEEVAAGSPEKVHRIHAEAGCGITQFQGRKIALAMGLEGGLIGKAATIVSALYQGFVEYDCTLAEINPLVLTERGELLALDAKMNIDDNALFRHPEIVAMRDVEQEDPRDTEATRLGLNFVPLSGNIGCVVNGAGLGMATLDILNFYGGKPANFLDAGAGASKEVIRNAFRLLSSDPRVKGILVNMFGGITRCDSYALGIVEALKERPLRIPLVVRLEGTNVELGRKILADSGLNIIHAADMREGAQTIVKLAAGEG